MKNRIVVIFAVGISILGISLISCKFLSSIPILNITPEATATATLSPFEARAGPWTGTTSFGYFFFRVSPDGNEINLLILSDFENMPEHGFAETVTIDANGKFEISYFDDLYTKIKGSKPFVGLFQGQFSEDGTSASGIWEITSPIKASEKWEIHDRVSGESQGGPISEATAPAFEPSPIPPTATKVPPTMEPLVIIRLSKSSMSNPIKLEVIKGKYKLVSGTELWEGSNISVQEDWLTFPTDLEIQVGEGGVTLKGKKYPSGSILYVNEQENLVVLSGETYTEASELPLDILGCNPVSECPDSAISIWSFFGEDEELKYNTEYPVSVPMDAEVGFFIGWCTLEQEMLEDNLKHIEFVFTSDGVSFIDQLKPRTYTVQDETDSTKLNYCHSVNGVVSGWQKDQAYQIVFGMIFKDTLFDGWDTYEPGDYTHIYLISVEP